MSRLKKSEVKILLDKDNPTKREMLAAVARGLTEQGGLFLPHELDERCGGCGRPVTSRTEYFGEEFCGECVSKWKQGLK